MQPVRILIVEDERNVATTLAHALTRASAGGYSAEVCFSAIEAIQRLRGTRYDLVISDLRLPSPSGRLPAASGLDLLAMVRRDYPRTRTILMTGFGSEEVEATARETTDAYLTKPFNLPDVIQLVRTVVRHPESGAGAQIVVVDDDLGELSRYLHELRAELGAEYVIVMAANGQTLAESGDPGRVERQALNALLCGGMAASGEIARAFAEPRPYDLHFFDGQHSEIYVRKLNENVLLALVLELHPDSPRMGLVWLALKRVLERVRERAAHYEAQISARLPADLAQSIRKGLPEEMDRVLGPAALPYSASTDDPPTRRPAPGSFDTFAFEEAVRRGIVDEDTAPPNRSDPRG